MLRLPLMARHVAFLLLALFALPQLLHAETHFIEAESFTATEGWKAKTNAQVQRASRVTVLSGTEGPADAIATHNVTIEHAGPYRIWVRAMQVAQWRGPFKVTVSAQGVEFAAKVLDEAPLPDVQDWNFTWHPLDAELPAGEVTLTLSKAGEGAVNGYTRQVDCLLITDDLDLVPDHVPFGPQTLLRVTMGPEITQSASLHIFADHYRDPWYTHHSIGRKGLHDGVDHLNEGLLEPGETSPWGNISHTIYQDSGACLNFTLRHADASKAERMQARVEFGRADHAGAEVQLVRSFEIDAQPGGVAIVVPPDLDSPENVARLRRDAEYAELTGALADAHAWPSIGKRPERIPFFVSTHINPWGMNVDADVAAREEKTLDYFGFNGDHERVLDGLWFMKNGSYAQPDREQMVARAQADFTAFQASGRDLDQVAYAILMDEPEGQHTDFMVKDEGYRTAFRAWLEGQGFTPTDLLVADWDAVRPVLESERDVFPALHYHTQRFRTVALGNFMIEQRKLIEATYGREFPTVVNFSDGALYWANFYAQGVDYFELLNTDQQNAIWSEDWANAASTYQCSAFNVDLMRAAARKRGQTMGHYLIAHAYRTAWDTKLKATSAAARGVRMWMNFSYGPTWGNHEGGPAWKSHMWYNKPENWTANAEIPREIGAVEDWLLTAKPAPAEVALLYSSSSDIWSLQNSAFGFDRMHTWLALSHGQVPVDVVSEIDLAEGHLSQYRVCYFSGENLTRAAATKLAEWVQVGGTLFMTAGAGTRDEYNRPLDTLVPLLPATREAVTVHEPFNVGGHYLSTLSPRDTVTWDGETLDVLAVQQAQSPKPNAATLATFANGQPAIVSAAAGEGTTISAGFLPALAYIRPALIAREASQKNKSDSARIERSYNPWDFPAGIRERILSPARDTKTRLTCDVPLVDAVYLPCVQGVLIALANYTLESVERIELRIRDVYNVTGVESVHHGEVTYEEIGDGEIRLSLPLDASDWLMISRDPGVLNTSESAALR